jgi:hypothetical protein
VAFVEAARLLALEAEACRRAILAARERVVFVMPRTVKGAAMPPHSMWDEITARLGIDEDPAAIARLTHEVGALVRNGENGFVPVTSIAALPLPEARGVWQVPADALAGDDARGTSATALQILASCPLAWVLQHRANLRSGAVTQIVDGPLLNGKLSHRLVEELFHAGAFELDEPAFLEQVGTTLEKLIHTEAATLLVAGAAFERTQLSRQIRDAIRGLHRYLRAAEFRIAAVEESIPVEPTIGTPHGRLDIRLIDKNGKDAVLDLKWGAANARALLEEGRAIQLAIYSLALRAKAGRTSVPPAAYFAMSSGQVLTSDPRMKAPKTIDGAALDETWNRIVKTRTAVHEALARGLVPVANTRRALPLLQQLEIPKDQRAAYYQSAREAPCQYCDFGPLCGRNWEDFQ